MYDPISLWMQSTLFWVKIIQEQQETCMRMIGAMAENIPHENAADLAKEAEELKLVVGDAVEKPRIATQEVAKPKLLATA